MMKNAINKIAYAKQLKKRLVEMKKKGRMLLEKQEKKEADEILEDIEDVLK